MTRDLSWSTIAETGDIGAVPEPPKVVTSRKWRPGKVSIAVLVIWLLWELAGLVRALSVGPEIIQAIWELRP